MFIHRRTNFQLGLFYSSNSSADEISRRLVDRSIDDECWLREKFPRKTDQFWNCFGFPVYLAIGLTHRDVCIVDAREGVRRASRIAATRTYIVASKRASANAPELEFRFFVGSLVRSFVRRCADRQEKEWLIAGSISRYRNNSCPRLESHGCAGMDRFAMPQPQNLAID